MDDNVEDFYGCYLLVCENPRYKGRTYIGYTRDPNRRIRQHNTGKHAGGAWRTSGKGPWAMVLIVHGFPNDISALRFEWAWQHPDKSRRLRRLTAKTRTESAFEYRLRIVWSMLRLGPWCRLPLTVRWLVPEYRRDFPPGLPPPVHMALAFGPVKARNKIVKPVSGEEGSVDKQSCSVCCEIVDDPDESVSCLHRCGATSHLLCLARRFLGASDQLVPMEGECPRCGRSALWGDLIRFMKGCYQQPAEEDTDHWADDLASQAVT